MALLTLAFVAACGPGKPPIPIPEPDVGEAEPLVREAVAKAQQAIREEPRSAAAWGHLGMVCHVHDLFDEAVVAYRQAIALDPEEVRWPYFLGDVLTTVGSDLADAEAQLRRTLELRPDYGPAYMRLGNVLVARGATDDAAAAFEKALELEPELHPARVNLGQARLAKGQTEEAVALLEEVLEVQPRNGRALAALGQAYNRLGRPAEAREAAEKAQDAAEYNLFADPLMSEVVALGASSILIWERAKGYFENGDYTQALIGLRQVVKLLPDNPGVHHQLAFIYRERHQLDRALPHLRKAVELEPERSDARVQLAAMLLEADRASEAAGHLRAVFEAEADDPEPGWLLGRALVRVGDAQGALEVFEESARRAAASADAADAPEDGPSIPADAHNEWGNVLAQSGHVDEAAAHFEAALAVEPRNQQSLFYMGLVQEARGRPAEARSYYEQALAVGPNDLVSARLAALGSAR